MSLNQVIRQKLQKNNIKVKDSGEDFILSQCLNPEHNDSNPSFSINLKTGFGFCFGCGYSVNRSYWLEGNEDKNEYERASFYLDLERKIKQKPISENKKHFTIFLPPKTIDLEAGWRGLTKKTIKDNGLYICSVENSIYNNRVIFPFYDYDNNLIGFNSRALSRKQSPKYLYAKHTQIKDIIYPLIREKTTELIIVEGVMDSLSLSQEGIPAIANLGISVNFTMDKILTLVKLGVEKLWLFFDEDEAGKNAYEKFFTSNLQDFFELDYGKNNPKLKEFFKTGYKDYNEYLQRKKGK